MKLMDYSDSLQFKYPCISEEWHPLLNGKLTPDLISAGSGKKVWWRCGKGHEWQASISNRILGNGCPFCSNQKVLEGYNDLATTNPELAAEWNYEKNGTLTPQMFVAGSEKKVWWRGKCGHEWETKINSRNRGSGCPICKGRIILEGYNDLATINPKLAAEWDYDKNGQLTPQMLSSGSHKKVWWICSEGHEWQAIVYHRANDNGCPFCSGRRVVAGKNDLTTAKPELSAEWDYEKNGALSPQDVSSCSNKKVWWKCKLGHEWTASINSRNNGNGCPFCSNQRVLEGFNDFATSNPELVAEWNYDRNVVLPTQVIAGGGKKYWWKCKLGHEWQAMITHRKKGVGCPICANQIVLPGFNDLATIKPELAKEWDYEKNGELTPQMVVGGSSKKVWWKCSKGHEWRVAISGRIQGNGCPYCSNKRVLEGYNDLATTNPELVAEWNYQKNGKLLPTMVTAGSNKSVWWQCKNGHVWKTSVNARSQGIGCAACSAHLKTSFPEQAIYYYVKQSYPDAINSFRGIFTSQNTVMELDIYIPSIKTAIEYDGIVWHNSSDALNREKIKYQECRKNGIRLIRIKENAEHDDSSCDLLIRSNYSSNYQHFNDVLFELSKYITLPNNFDCNRDRNIIMTKYLPDFEKDSLFYTNPELMSEWNYERNTDISPKQIMKNSLNKVWWKCSKGHEWQASVKSRARGTKCPYCSNHKVLVGFNDLATTNPALVAEWHPIKNGSLSPKNVSIGSGKKVWWICEKQHEWQATINSRKENDGCPYCSGHRVAVGFNDLSTINPMLASEWDYSRNGELSPKSVTAGSNKKVWWKCSKGHEWQAQINARNRGNGCPFCSGRKKSVE